MEMLLQLPSNERPTENLIAEYHAQLLTASARTAVSELATGSEKLSRVGDSHANCRPDSFFADRLKVQLRDQGARHDLVDAVFALEGQDDLLLIVRRVEALGKFLDTEDGKNLLAGYKRATNIIRIEEKKDGREYTGAPDPNALPAGRGEGAGAGDRYRQGRGDARCRQPRISPPPCAPWRSYALTSMPSSTR